MSLGVHVRGPAIDWQPVPGVAHLCPTEEELAPAEPETPKGTQQVLKMNGCMLTNTLLTESC